MGTDEFAVVDHELRVRGLDGLRVADASIMPRGHTTLPTMIIAEKVAHLIHGTRVPVTSDGHSEMSPKHAAAAPVV